MTYLNKGQFYPITLREVDSKALQQPITKVRVRQEERGTAKLTRIPAAVIETVFCVLERCDGSVWRGEVQRRSAEALEVLALQTAHG